MMKDLKNWIEVTQGLYMYAIAPNVAYEIHILCWYHDTNILTAMASLYIVGDWNTKNNEECIEIYTGRECILKERPLMDCLEAASKMIESGRIYSGGYYKINESHKENGALVLDNIELKSVGLYLDDIYGNNELKMEVIEND